MALRFVKTSILSSTDGIDFGNEISIDSEEVIKARVAAEAAKNKPLYQQLADIKERKQEEYNENTKKLFAPPKALDEDEIEFFNELEDAKQKVALENKKHDNTELESFRQARKIDMLNNNYNNSTVPLIKFIPPKKVEPTSNTVHFTMKRKISKDSKSGDTIQHDNNKKQNHKTNSNDCVDTQINKVITTSSSGSKTDNNTVAIETPTVAGGASSSLFAAYDSDSD